MTCNIRILILVPLFHFLFCSQLQRDWAFNGWGLGFVVFFFRISSFSCLLPPRFFACSVGLVRDWKQYEIKVVFSSVENSPREIRGRTRLPL